MALTPSSFIAFNFGPDSVKMAQPQTGQGMQNSQQPMPAYKPDSFSRRNMNDPTSGNSNNAFFLPATPGNSFK